MTKLPLFLIGLYLFISPMLLEFKLWYRITEQPRYRHWLSTQAWGSPPGLRPPQPVSKDQAATCTRNNSLLFIFSNPDSYFSRDFTRSQSRPVVSPVNSRLPNSLTVTVSSSRLEFYSIYQNTFSAFCVTLPITWRLQNILSTIFTGRFHIWKGENCNSLSAIYENIW